MLIRGYALFVVAAWCTTAWTQVDPALYGGLRWRELGPARGGRSVAVSGVPGKPDEFYMGTCGGGLWKSINAGQDWACVSDGFFQTGNVGAIGVSPSKPDVVYVGMGECCIRGNISHGDGMYKSTDGGKTWTHMGLADTQSIAKVRVHPKNPDIVYAAVLGHIYGPHDSRGIYKTTDGGLTWMKVLFVNDRSGGIDLSIDQNDPEIIYAATWEAWRTPYTMNSGGPGSRLYKSTDAGKTWTDLSKNSGLPKGMLGKIGVSVSPADSRRVYAAIESLDGGIFRSDDAGATWTLLSDNRNYRQRAWYYTHILADPKEADKAYILNVGNGRTTDGGKTWSGWMAGHSDNHDIWVDPNDTSRMIVGNDGGAAVTTNGGRTWSDQDFPTAQFYHVSADNAMPYRILGAQQDNSTVRLLSRGSLPGSGGPGRPPTNWTGTAGGESGYVVAKPDNPEIVFGGSYGGYLEMLNHATGVSRNLNAWPDEPMGHGAIDLVQRIQWTFPILFSPHDPNVLYTCSQFVLKSTNGGQSWKKVSPDLTRNDPKTMGASGGPITKDNTSVEYYGTVFTIAESPKRRGVLWAGSDDGLVHVSQDGGKSWKNVTPKAMPEWALCSMIEASHHDPATAYLAVDNHENDDHSPLIFRTKDYGQTWDKLVSGIPKNAYVRVVREDPTRPGMLFAGTEIGVWVSFSDGASWQPLQLNLPIVPIHDLYIKSGDLIAATHGRSFWTLEDIAPLRDLVDGTKANASRFFQPADATRARFGGFRGGGAGDGVNLSYFLAEKVQTVKIEIKNAAGQVFFSRDNNPTDAGMHRVAAYLSVPSYRTFAGMILWSGGRGAIAAPPGQYIATLTAGSYSASKTFRWSGDPRTGANDADLQAQYDLAIKVRDAVSAANDAVSMIRDIRQKSDAAIAKAADLKTDGDALSAKLTAVEEALYQTKNRSGQDPLNYPVRLNNKLASLLGVILSGDWRPTDQCYEVFEMLSKQLAKELDTLKTTIDKDLAAFNEKLKQKQLPPIVPAARPNPGGEPR